MLHLCIFTLTTYCQNRVWTSSLANPTPQAGHFLCREAILLSRQPLQNANESVLHTAIRLVNSLCIHLIMTCCLKFCSQHEHFKSFYSSARSHVVHSRLTSNLSLSSLNCHSPADISLPGAAINASCFSLNFLTVLAATSASSSNFR